MPLRKVCRRLKTDHRLQLLHALNDSAIAKHPKAGCETKNQQPNVSEIVDAGLVKIPDALPGNGVQLLEAPGLINPVRKIRMRC